MRYQDPFEQMNRLLEQIRRSTWYDFEPFAMRPRLPAVESGLMSFHLDVEEAGDEYVVRADVPGFDPEDLHIRFEDGVLTVEGVTEVTDEDETGWHRRSHRIVEEVKLAESVIEDEMRATYNNGVLEIHLPTESPLDEGAGREIEIDID